jgi:hypothetical protein
MIGSMGLASSIAWGWRARPPGAAAIVFDGDGNLLMNLGILPGGSGRRSGGAVHRHVVADSVYGSTAGGWHRHRAASASTRGGGADMREARRSLGGRGGGALRGRGGGGPSFILVRVSAEERTVPRIPIAPRRSAPPDAPSGARERRLHRRCSRGRPRLHHWLVWDLGPAAVGDIRTPVTAARALVLFVLRGRRSPAARLARAPARLPRPVGALASARLAGGVRDLLTPRRSLGGEPLRHTSYAASCRS